MSRFPTRAPTTSVGLLLREYAARRGVSASEVARRVGRSRQAVNALMLGHEGPGQTYLGLKVFRRGDLPLVFLVGEALEVPDLKLRRAIHEDQIAALNDRAAAVGYPATPKRTIPGWRKCTARRRFLSEMPSLKFVA